MTWLIKKKKHAIKLTWSNDKHETNNELLIFSNQKLKSVNIEERAREAFSYEDTRLSVVLDSIELIEPSSNEPREKRHSNPYLSIIWQKIG